MPQKAIGFREVFFKISSLAFPMALSYTFSFAIVAFGLIGNSLFHDSDHTAAITLIMTSTNTLTIMALSPLFSMSIIASHLIGSLKNATSAEAVSQKKSVFQPLIVLVF